MDTLLPLWTEFRTNFPITSPLHDHLLSASTDWSSLDPSGRHTFRFSLGTTPFSTLGTVVYGCVFYHLILWLIVLAMKATGHPGHSLKALTAAHNFILCAFSAVVFGGCVYDTVAYVREFGWRRCMCAVEEGEATGALYYWGYVFYLSKYWEFIDTFILALKRKSLTVLHVYHHTVVVLMMWSFFPANLSLVSWGVLANGFVHIWMYLYFCLASLGVKGLGPFRVAMTQTQIIQFVWSFAGSAPFLAFAFGYAGNDIPVIRGGLRCMGAPAFYFGSVINATFLGLFVNFYRSAYKIKKNKKSKSE